MLKQLWLNVKCFVLHRGKHIYGTEFGYSCIGVGRYVSGGARSRHVYSKYTFNCEICGNESKPVRRCNLHTLNFHKRITREDLDRF